MPGKLYLVPNTLDFGIGSGDHPLPDIQQVLPLGTIEAAACLTHWVTENAKTTRAFLKRVHAVRPLPLPLQELHLVELPRPPKGQRGAIPAPELSALLQPALDGSDIGLNCEAGMPAVADPGAELVRQAHELGIEVVPLVGPSALLLALAASGMNGQSFAFVGYLPVEEPARAQRIKELEALARRVGQTQLMIETPYRNAALLQALLKHLQPGTRVSVSCALTLDDGWTASAAVSRWRERSGPGSRQLPADRPAVFAIHAS
jgi:16S rRNA (cytidine1402-2'-O)-methyltransferase